MKIEAYKVSPKDNILLIKGLIQSNESDLDVEEFISEFFDQFVIFRKIIRNLNKVKILPVSKVGDDIEFHIKIKKEKLLTNFISTFSEKEVSFRGRYIIKITCDDDIANIIIKRQ